jgi:mannose-1-phosphate guanylyltransferase / mannose-6-phosphate isomerase
LSPAFAAGSAIGGIIMLQPRRDASAEHRRIDDMSDAIPDLITPVVLSGGSGTRLWPLSRDLYPKQLLALIGPESLLAVTARRVSGDSFAGPVIVCNADHKFLVQDQLAEIGIVPEAIIIEPVARNTAPAIAAAAALLRERDPDALMLVLPSDHIIRDLPALTAAIGAAAKAADTGCLVTFGITPTAPETGYGYIEIGPELPASPGVHAVARFMEKPDAATAAELVKGGRHLWNSGMFVFTARTLLREMAEHAPEVLPPMRDAVAGRKSDLDFIRLAAEPFRACPSISIDYAIAERTREAAVVPASIGWSDIGSWSALWEVSGKDDAGNVAIGDVVLEDARDCYVRSDGMLTAVIGLKDAVVVVTEDVALAMHRDQAQDVKKVVDRLKAMKRHEAVAHNRVYRPWGFYETLIVGERFQVKRITVSPGGKLSLQSHFHRAEHWVVVNGTARVTRDQETMILRENESVYLPLGCMHRLENPGLIPLALIEVQSGAYLGEDDIVRVEDTYGRV